MRKLGNGQQVHADSPCRTCSTSSEDAQSVATMLVGCHSLSIHSGTRVHSAAPALQSHQHWPSALRQGPVSASSFITSDGCGWRHLTHAWLAEALKADAGFPTAHQVYASFVVFCLTLHTWLFRRLHRSDPGWVPCGIHGPAAPSSDEHGMPMPTTCQHCGAVPPLRSRHDFKTGVMREHCR